MVSRTAAILVLTAVTAAAALGAHHFAIVEAYADLDPRA